MTSTRVEVVYNGYEPDDYEDIVKTPRRNNKRFEIVYTGTIYNIYQDPAPLFQAVKELMAEEKVGPDDLHITFAGHKSSNLSDMAKAYGIDEFFTYAGFLPRESALALQYNADACLFLEYNNPSVKGVLTGKLFEYIYIAREIWAIGVDDKTTSGSLIEKTKTGICFGNDVNKIKKYIINRVVDNKHCTNRERDMSAVRQFERKMQASKILKIIEDI